MPSDNLTAAAEASRRGTAGKLLDPLFGYLVWALHFLLVYCANGLACARGIGASSASTQTAFRWLLVAVTFAALAVVIVHAVLRWRGRDQSHPILTDLAVANDAIAAVGIALQLFPLLMLQLCR